MDARSTSYDADVIKNVLLVITAFAVLADADEVKAAEAEMTEAMQRKNRRKLMYTETSVILWRVLYGRISNGVEGYSLGQLARVLSPDDESYRKSKAKQIVGLAEVLDDAYGLLKYEEVKGGGCGKDGYLISPTPLLIRLYERHLLPELETLIKIPEVTQ